MDLFTNKAQFDAGFSERLNLKDDAVPTILNPTVAHKCNCFYYVVTIALCHGVSGRKSQETQGSSL